MNRRPTLLDLQKFNPSKKFLDGNEEPLPTKPASARNTFSKVILNSIATPTLNKRVASETYKSEKDYDFHPPVPQSTAALLAIAEDKVNKVMANKSKPPSERRSLVTKSRSKLKTGKVSQSKASLSRSKSKQNNLEDKASSILGTLVNDPLRWLREEHINAKGNRERSLSRTRSKSREVLKSKGEISQPEDTSGKTITIGGHVITIEKNVQPNISTTVSTSIASNYSGFEVEVHLKGVEPERIVTEKRYNSILVVGFKPKEDDESFDLVEVVNIFAPIGSTLGKVMASNADGKGRVFIKIP